MTAKYVVARYHEVALKGGNRRLFVQRLERNIRRMLEGTGVSGVHRGPGRVIIALRPDADWPAIRARLARVFGVANFLLSQPCERDLDRLALDVLAALDSRPIGSFAVRTKRTDKTFPILSPEICRIVGRAVQERTGARVDLERPETEIHVEVLPRELLFSLEKVAGPGGLPGGSSGKVLALLSGGIDSPVAAHRMMQRGCEVEFVHFHSAPFQSRASQEKAVELLEALAQWQPDARLHLVPFGLVQREIVARAKRRTRVILYRRMMMRIASALAARVGAEALVTGESLGQVASQTLPNLATIEDAATLPVLRPLIGMDKQEIMDRAEVLGTFPISIQPDEDCCQLFVPRHPATRMSAASARAAEEELDVEALVRSALQGVETVDARYPPAPLRTHSQQDVSGAAES
jgi:thiamine biosynthesis protein ThiI